MELGLHSWRYLARNLDQQQYSSSKFDVNFGKSLVCRILNLETCKERVCDLGVFGFSYHIKFGWFLFSWLLWCDNVIHQPP